jgi:NTP pyrophosphatase (non-canonical NTP hydrolase)
MSDPWRANADSGLDEIQQLVIRWQADNFPGCEEWELALGVCEEAGELAQCILKLHRRMRQEEFDEARLKDAVGDVVVYLMGICGARGWKLSEVVEETARRVTARRWNRGS